MVCIRLDATVIAACSEKEGAEPNYKGFGHHPLLAYCDNTAEPLAAMLRPGSAWREHHRRSPAGPGGGDHRGAGEVPAAADGHLRRRGSQHGLITRLDELGPGPAGS